MRCLQRPLRLLPALCLRGANGARSWGDITHQSVLIPHGARHCSSSSSGDGDINDSSSTSGSSGSSSSFHADGTVRAQFPIVQLPARSLWCRQFDVNLRDLARGEHTSMIQQVIDSRKYYQYPSLSAPQVGWNVRMFTLFDDTVYINPEIVEVSELECWAWEPCASCAFLMHYIQRPKEVTIRFYDREGKQQTQKLSKMRARMALHEMDHLDGVLFTRRIPDTQHVVPLDGFNTMSDWPDDYPSLEARSTFLYSTFTPPYYFETDDVSDASMLDRKFEDNIYPGHEHDAAVRINTQAHLDTQRGMWQTEKAAREDTEAGAEPATMPDMEVLEKVDTPPS